MNSDYAKEKVRSFWDEQTCGTQFTQSEKFSKQYFDDIESDRYTKEPEILEFADFENSKGKVVLEVGTGAATDFMQWAKYCQELYGVDLTPQSVQHAQKRLALYGLTAKQILVADAQQNASDRLHDENKKQDRAKYIRPPRPARDGLIEHFGL